MEIFNIHIFEFLLIAALALIVFGPERLPEVGRFIGKQVARFLAWQQQSPELRLINDVRSEFEREIASIRDELIRTRNQLDVSRDVEALRGELQPMLNMQLNTDARHQQVALETPANPARTLAADPAVDSGPSNPALPAPEQGAVAEAAAPPAAPNSAGPAATPPAAGEQLAELPTPPTLTPQPAAQAVPATTRPNRIPGTEPTGVLQPVDERARYLAERRARLHDLPEYDDAPNPNGAPAAPQPDPPPAPLPGDEREQLLRQIQALSHELQALVGELRERGIIGMDWTPHREHSQETLSQ